MKIALFGYGKMGQLVEQEAKLQGHQVTAIFSRRLGLASKDASVLSQANIAIDFSICSSVIEHLSICLSLGIPLVIGTTGWEHQVETAKELVLRANGSCLHAPNFSIGVYLYRQVLKYAAALFQQFPEYDVCGIESHHRQKLDSPSGTAKAISKELLEHIPRLHSIDFASVRCGHIPGTHTIQFDSQADSLSFTHQARNRDGFAYGAVIAASWLLKHKGFYTLEDMMNDIQQGSL